jgi:hypothetical protein
MLLNRELGEDAVPAYRLFSLVNFARQKLDDALEYLSFALEQAEKRDQPEELVSICYFGASINLIYGNLSRAERLANKAEETAFSLGLEKWGGRVKFLRGRLCFETGKYNDALGIFESLNKEQTENGTQSESGALLGISDTIKAWVSRTRVFTGRFALENLCGHDASLFEIEAAYFAGDYQKAAALAGTFLASIGKAQSQEFLYTEQPDWRSGFCQCEYLFQPEKIQGKRLAWVYRAMAQCANRPSKETKDEILSGIQRFMRDELLPDTDPNDAFFFHGWYKMLKDTEAAQVDLNTVVSMAYKRLQRRAGRIDDKQTRQDYLTLPLWNKTLLSAAREYMLV